MRLFTGFLTICWLPLCGATIHSAAGITVAVDEKGYYSVSYGPANWVLSGELGALAIDLTTSSGRDQAGTYEAVSFTYEQGGTRWASIRIYGVRRAVVFLQSYQTEAANDNGFPAFNRLPTGLSHMSYWNQFAQHNFGPLSEEGPRLYFEAGGPAFIVSPASNFMVARTRTTDTGFETGISSAIKTLPADFTHSTLLVFGSGVNATFEGWGKMLTDLQGKHRPANDADATLRMLGYWTDAGANYYYNSEASAGGYEGTLQEIKAELHDQGIGLGYMQLDSWFYPKGAAADWHDRKGGTYTYTAHKDNFPGGLSSFQQKLELPLVTHNRWIDVSSPYRHQYRFSGNVSTDPAFWTMLAASLKESGVGTYEQDWLSSHAHADFNLTDPDRFLTEMSTALAAQGITMQYCMATPSHFMQGAKYSNLTTIRTSMDHFGRTRWQEFLYASRFASALGIYPWADVFMSSEPDNLLLATLSAGPVGIGDKIASFSAANLLHAVRRDGVIVKPDVPMVPLDSAFTRDSVDDAGPLVSSTYTAFHGFRASYVFSFARGSDTLTQFRPAELGYRGAVYVYNYFTGQGIRMDAAENYSEPMPGDRGYYIVVPVNAKGIAVIGDTENFISLGKKRITNLVAGEEISLTVMFAAGETARTLHGYAEAAPRFFVSEGKLLAQTYDPSTHHFTVTLAPWKAAASVTIAPGNMKGCARARQCTDSVLDAAGR